METETQVQRHLSKLALQAAMIVVPIGLSVLVVDMHANADNVPFGGTGGAGGAIPVADVVPVDGAQGGDATRLIRAPQDNRRTDWQWSPETGWVSDVQEQTYQNGWAWVWHDGEWHWEQETLHGAAADLMNAGTMHVSADSVPEPETPVCFDVSGALTGDRASCASDQKWAALKADPDTLPASLQSIVRDSAPYAAGEETRVLYLLNTRFDGDAVMARKTALTHAASDVVHRLGTLKALDSITDNERQYYIAKIADAQKFLTATQAASTQNDVTASTESLATLVQEVAAYTKSHGITTDTSGAPTVPTLLADTQKILRALPSAFSALDDAGYSSDALRSMQAQTVVLAANVALTCSQGRECARISDVIDQLQKTVSTLNEMVSASGNSHLKTEVQSRFDRAISGR